MKSRQAGMRTIWAQGKASSYLEGIQTNSEQKSLSDMTLISYEVQVCTGGDISVS